MSVEVLPLVAPHNNNNNALFASSSRRKMGARFFLRWIVFLCIICGIIIYFADYLPLELRPTWRSGLISSGHISVPGGTVDPLVSDIEGQIKVRKNTAGGSGNLFPVDPDAMKKVLFWTNFFGTPDPRGSMGSRMFEGCPVKQCESISDKTLVATADAVIFHAVDIDPNSLPKRGSKQHFVFFVGESPVSLLNRIPATPAGFFDMTYTYRLDSDVLGNYMYSVPQEHPPKNFVQGKTKLVAWLVSNCETSSKRENYAKELQKHIPVDIYGKCGPLKCPRTNEAACSERLKKDYKFYLAFENSYRLTKWSFFSICRDYVTEKFTNTLHHYVVPVVLGAGNMTIFPTHSYIHVDDFDTPKALAEYLQYLDKNDTAYNEYMNWRFDPAQVTSHGRYSPANTNWCQLCEKLHDPSFEAKEYSDARKWFIEGGHCRGGKW